MGIPYEEDLFQNLAKFTYYPMSIGVFGCPEMGLPCSENAKRRANMEFQCEEIAKHRSSRFEVSLQCFPMWETWLQDTFALHCHVNVF